MAKQKEKLPHEKTIDNVIKQVDAKDAYVWAHKFEHEQIINDAKKKIIDRLGAEKAYKYLDSDIGKREYADLATKDVEARALKKLGLKKDNIKDIDLGLLVQGLYGINHATFLKLARKHGSKLDHALYAKDFLTEHLQQIDQYVTSNHIAKTIKTDEMPTILKHIGADRYLKDVTHFKDEQYKPLLIQMISGYKEAGNTPLGKDFYIYKDPNFNIHLKDQYKNAS